MSDGSLAAVFASRGWSVECVTTQQALLALKVEWQELEQTVGTDLPFQTWEWCVSWWAHFRENRLGVRDSLRVCAVRLNDRLIGVAPFMLTERPAVGPFRSRLLQFIGADPNITEIRTMLCIPEFAKDSYRALEDYFRARNSDWDWIAWEIPSGISTGITRESGFVAKRERLAYVLPLGSTWDELLAGLHRSTRGLVRKYYRDLAANHLSVRLEVLEQPADVTSALSDFFRLFAAREVAKGSRGQPQLFASPQAQAFLTETCSRLASRGVARVFRLWVGHTMVATRVAFLMGERLYLYYSGWDSDYARYSVMTVLVAEILQYAIDHKVRSVHLSTGKDLSKTRWSPTELSYAEGIQLNWRLGAAVRHRAHDAVVRIGASKLASRIIPSALLRRSRLEDYESLPVQPVHYAQPFHVLASAAAVLATIDMLDGKLDHAVHAMNLVH